MDEEPTLETAPKGSRVLTNRNSSQEEHLWTGEACQRDRGNSSLHPYQQESRRGPAELIGEGFLDTLAEGKGFQSDHREKLRQGLIGPKRDEKEKITETEHEQQERLKQYFEEYDKKHRPKTLLELHQEKTKAEKGGYNEERPFSRDDMGYSRVDSKNVFKIVSAAGANLTSKFADGKFKGTFI